MSSLVIGVLALQGAFARHAAIFQDVGVKVVEVRKPADLAACDALVIPGGESTTIMKQMQFIDFFDAFIKFSAHKPVFGTCAGLILMSKKVTGNVLEPFNLEVQDNKVMQDFDSESLSMGADHSQKVKAAPIRSDYGSKDCVKLLSSTAVSRFNLLDVEVERNAFGRQAESFQTDLDICLKGRSKQIPATFIRAPRIRHVGQAVDVLGSFEGEPVLVQQGLHLGATFHPELTQDHTIHAYFLSLVESSRK